jgi:hypothetical protein
MLILTERGSERKGYSQSQMPNAGGVQAALADFVGIDSRDLLWQRATAMGRIQMTRRQEHGGKKMHTSICLRPHLFAVQILGLLTTDFEIPGF